MRSLYFGLTLCLAVSAMAFGQTVYVDQEKTVAIDQSRGVDELVDYDSLVNFGPWDDRNYELTRGDLALLSAREASLRSPLPAFVRVELRKTFGFASRDDVRYPLSALNVFRNQLGGYLIDGVYYRKAYRDGDRYYVRLQSGTPSSPDGAGEGAATDVVTGEVRVTSPVGAAESAIAINPTNTSELVAGSNGPNGGQRMHYSKDGGASWTQVDLPLGGTCCDPTVEWSSDGQYAYTATLGCFFFFCDLWFYRSDDGGVTWTSFEDITPGDPRREIDTNNVDREYMHVDQAPGSPHLDNIYFMYHSGNVMQFARSTDFGNTWSKQSFGSESEERGIAGDIATDKNGHIYYAWPAFNSRTIRLRKSTDGGQSFSASQVVADTNASFAYPIPAMDSREAAVYIAADADLTDGPYANSVYLAWSDATGPTSGDPASNHSWIRVAHSRDGGATWNVTTPHETDDLLTVDRWQTFLAVGDDGVVHVIYNDTRNSADRTGVDLYYSYSTDGAETWSEPQRVTSEMSPSIEDGFEYGDYSGLDIVMDDLVAIFTDNRNESGGTNDSVDVYMAGIEPGTASGAAPGRIRGALGIEGTPLAVARAGGEDVTLTWAEVCGAGSDYAVYEGELPDIGSKSQRLCSTGGATTATFTPDAGQRFFLVVASDGSSEGSYGQASDGSERTPAASPCFSQDIGPCP